MRRAQNLMNLHVGGVQVTAYQVIQSSTTGHLPTTVQFNIANPSDRAVRCPAFLPQHTSLAA